MEFEKKKIKVSQLEFEASMLQNTIKKMQERDGVVLYPQHVFRDTSYKFDLNDPQGKFTLCVNGCLVCAQ
jgi:hypothetical protein